MNWDETRFRSGDGCFLAKLDLQMERSIEDDRVNENVITQCCFFRGFSRAFSALGERLFFGPHDFCLTFASKSERLHIVCLCHGSSAPGRRQGQAAASLLQVFHDSLSLPRSSIGLEEGLEMHEVLFSSTRDTYLCNGVNRPTGVVFHDHIYNDET